MIYDIDEEFIYCDFIKIKIFFVFKNRWVFEFLEFVLWKVFCWWMKYCRGIKLFLIFFGYEIVFIFVSFIVSKFRVRVIYL